MNIKYLFIILILILYSCQSVSKKIDENVQKEERELSKLLNSSEDELKIEMGNPDRIIFKALDTFSFGPLGPSGVIPT